MKQPRGWGYWTEIKLDALARYLKHFAVAAQRAPNTLYLDLFAGSVDNVSRDQPDRHFAGSTVRALATTPQFTRLCFFEMKEPALDLNRQLRQQFPNDDRWRVVPGDCNQTVGRVLDDLRRENLHWSPTFAFIDPDGLDVDWATLARIANFRHPDAKTKSEMWILFSHYAIPRLDGFDRTRDSALSHRVTALFGTDRWRRIADQRRSDSITASHARRLYIAYFRHRLQTDFGYRTTMTLDMGNDHGTPIYTMVFATDHDAGVRIMTSVIEQARDQTAEFRQQAKDAREREQRDQSGVNNLFDVMDAPTPTASSYFALDYHIDPEVLPHWLLDG